MVWFKKRPKPPVRQPHLDTAEQVGFRRSRTLTGSAADSVRSANEAGLTQLKSDRIKEHHLRRRRRRLGWYMLGLIAIIAGLGYLIGQFVWSVDSINTTAFSSRTAQADYRQAVDDYYAARPLERFRFALDRADLVRQLAAKYPEVASADVEAGRLPLTGQLSLDFRRPILVWQIDSTRYYVDAAGVAFTNNYFDEPELIVEDKSGLPPQAGLVASSGILSFIGQVVALVDDGRVGQVAKVILPPGKTHEIDL
ncbi:MAG TPA: hypothetical protein VFK03_00180, partial [Candidatus Saccharimonadales bacterium]|nr:hypothetical protein [Candidatus Saccharimonadales bacterium]